MTEGNVDEWGDLLPVTRTLSRVEYRELRAERGHLSRADDGSAVYQKCSRCGLCEVAGGYCSGCGPTAYDLAAHLHTTRGKCPMLAPDAPVLGVYHHEAYASAVTQILHEEKE